MAQGLLVTATLAFATLAFHGFAGLLHAFTAGAFFGLHIAAATALFGLLVAAALAFRTHLISPALTFGALHLSPTLSFVHGQLHVTAIEFSQTEGVFSGLGGCTQCQ